MGAEGGVEKPIGGGGGEYPFVACFSRLTIDHACTPFETYRGRRGEGEKPSVCVCVYSFVASITVVIYLTTGHARPNLGDLFRFLSEGPEIIRIIPRSVRWVLPALTSSAMIATGLPLVRLRIVDTWGAKMRARHHR